MAMSFKDLEREAMDLPEEQRLELAERLTESIYRVTDPAMAQAWEDEAARRVEQIRLSADVLVDGDEVLREADAILNEEV